MLKRRLCEARFKWHLKCDGPLLIADGRYKQPETRNERDKGKFPDKLFISHDDPKNFNQESKLADPGKLKYYVPGTSLRGPFRSQAERIIRSLAPEGATPPRTACDPLDTEAPEDGEPRSCSSRLEKIAREYPYKHACPACKLFGCTGTASRIQFEDADVKGYNSVYRDMIGIDRFTGGVYTGPRGGANMRFHVLENSSFTTTVTVQNFELWQLGLLAYVFRDFEERLVPIGFGKTKGFGLVTGEIQKITLTYPKVRCDGMTIPHLGCLACAEERSSYGFLDDPAPKFGHLRKRDAGPLGLYCAYDVEPNDWDAFYAAVTPPFDRFIDSLAQEVCS